MGWSRPSDTKIPCGNICLTDWVNFKLRELIRFITPSGNKACHFSAFPDYSHGALCHLSTQNVIPSRKTHRFALRLNPSPFFMLYVSFWGYYFDFVTRLPDMEKGTASHEVPGKIIQIWLLGAINSWGDSGQSCYLSGRLNAFQILSCPWMDVFQFPAVADYFVGFSLNARTLSTGAGQTLAKKASLTNFNRGCTV